MKATIIEIDLGFNVDDIVREASEAVTGETAAKIDSAITSLNAARNARLTAESAATIAVDATLERIIKAGDMGLPPSIIIQESGGFFKSTTQMVGLVKGHLLKRGMRHLLGKKKLFGTVHYYVYDPYVTTEPVDSEVKSQTTTVRPAVQPTPGPQDG